MTVLLLFFGLSMVIFIFLYRQVTLYRVRVFNELRHEQSRAQSHFDAMAGRKRELAQELAEKEALLSKLRNNRGKAAPAPTRDQDLDHMDQTEKISRHLLSHGLITLEQNERALQKMNILKMDFLGVCAALGFVDLKTSQEVLATIKESKSAPVRKPR